MKLLGNDKEALGKIGFELINYGFNNFPKLMICKSELFEFIFFYTLDDAKILKEKKLDEA